MLNSEKIVFNKSGWNQDGLLLEVTEEDYKEAKNIGTERKLPPGDVLHALLVRKN